MFEACDAFRGQGASLITLQNHTPKSVMTTQLHLRHTWHG